MKRLKDFTFYLPFLSLILCLGVMLANMFTPQGAYAVHTNFLIISTIWAVFVVAIWLFAFILRRAQKGADYKYLSLIILTPLFWALIPYLFFFLFYLPSLVKLLLFQ